MVATRDQPATPRRRLTADYHPIVARAVAPLGNDSAQARADVYERARQTLLRHLQSMEPPFSGAEIAAELWALDQAIEQCEAPFETTKSPPSPASDADVHRPPRKPNPTKQAALVIVPIAALISAGLIYGPLWIPTAGHGAALLAIAIYTVVVSALPITIVNVWHRRRLCRDAGLVKHRDRVFARRNVDAQVLRETAGRMADRALLWAYVLPEHQVAAKLVIREELQRRGHTQDDLDRWAPRPADVTVPSALEAPMTIERYRALIRRRTWLFNGYLVVLTLLSALLVIIVVSQIANRQWNDIKSAVGVMGVLMFGLAGLASLPFRNRTLRILLLRPFGERKMTRALKHFVRKKAGRVGNVFTLSDRNYKPNLLIQILWRLPAEGLDLLFIFLIGPLLGHSKRIASVKSEGKFRKLERHLLRKYSPAFWSFMSGNQAFNIRSSDPWWKLCIHMLMHSCEIIVVDLSKVKEGTAWELEQLHAKALLGKCVFVVGEEHVADVPQMLDRYFQAARQPKVHVYRRNGTLMDQPSFDDRFTLIMQSGLAGWGSRSAA